MTEKGLTQQQLKAIESVRKNPINIKRYREEDRFYKLCLEAVRREGIMLQYVPNQTPEICLEAG